MPERDDDNQTPPRDDRQYFKEDEFGPEEPPHDPVMSDSENALYLIQFETKKPVSWPRTDHGFEHAKAKTGKCINRLEKHLAELKDRHRTLMGRRYAEVINSDDEEGFSWIKL